MRRGVAKRSLTIVIILVVTAIMFVGCSNEGTDGGRAKNGHKSGYVRATTAA